MSTEEHPSKKRSTRLAELTPTYRIIPKRHDETYNVCTIAEVEQKIATKMIAIKLNS